MEWIFFDVFSSNQILWDPCNGVVYPTWEYIESYGTYKWHHVHIWQGVQCIHQMSLYILLSFPLTFNQQMEAYPYLGDPQRPMYSPHVSIYSSQFWSPEAYMESCMLICIFADMLQCMQICIYAYIYASGNQNSIYICMEFWYMDIWNHVWETPASNVFTARLFTLIPPSLSPTISVSVTYLCLVNNIHV